MKFFISAILLSSAFSAHASHSIYAYCESIAYRMPQTLKHTATVSTCFKATSIMDQDGGNIAHNFCRQWGREVGLEFKYENSEELGNGGHAQTLNGQAEYMTTREECEADLSKRLAEYRRNKISEEKVGSSKLVVVDLFNGIVPSKVTATKFTTLKFECSTDWCWDKHD